MKAVAAIRTADETVHFAQGLALLLVIFLVLLIQRGGVPIG
tara:strand:- start:864 stop:986 length:123 start_codon:yes stop_codon:yes gene_type:complete